MTEAVQDVRKPGAIRARIARWRKKYPNAYEFIMFNLLANIATITNFVVLFVCNALVFATWADVDFRWGPFDYSVANGGLASFLSFLLAYGAAQTVNFIVQRKMVFYANNRLGPAIVIYTFAVVVVYFICLYVPTLVIAPLTAVVGGWAPYAANVLNIMIQVVILYPTMKFIVMRKANTPPGQSPSATP